MPGELITSHCTLLTTAALCGAAVLVENSAARRTEAKALEASSSINCTIWSKFRLYPRAQRWKSRGKGIAFLVVLMLTAVALGQKPPMVDQPLILDRIIAIPGAEGRFDHMTVDAKTGRNGTGVSSVRLPRRYRQTLRLQVDCGWACRHSR